MPLIPKPNYNQIFASQAPDIDKPAVFNNYPEGWGPESRPNNGKPTIKGFNYLQQTSDLKDLWILQNGACLPYDESIEYAEGAPVLKDGVIQYKTANGFSPVASEKPYILKYFTDGTSYPLNARVMLSNGDIVKSTIDGNAADPNSDMTGWVSIGNIGEADSIADLLATPNPHNGMCVYVKSYHAGLNSGGGTFVYDINKSSINDNALVINGWVRQDTTKLTPEMFGAKANDESFDNTNALNQAFATGQDIYSTPDKIYTTNHNLKAKGQRLIGGWKIRSDKVTSRAGQWIATVDTAPSLVTDKSTMKIMYVAYAYDLAEFLYIKSLGFNTLNHYCGMELTEWDNDGDEIDMLNNAKSAGLDVIVGTQIDSLALSNLPAFIQSVDSYEVVIGYSVFDEPSNQPIPISVLDQDVKINLMRGLTSKLLTVVDFGVTPLKKKLSDNYDIIFLDVYNADSLPTGTVNEEALEMEDDLYRMRANLGLHARQYKSKIIPVVQAFEWNYAVPLSRSLITSPIFAKSCGGNFGAFAWDGDKDVVIKDSVRNSAALQDMCRDICAYKNLKPQIPTVMLWGKGSIYDTDNGVYDAIKHQYVAPPTISNQFYGINSAVWQVAHGDTESDFSTTLIPSGTFAQAIWFKGQDGSYISDIPMSKYNYLKVIANKFTSGAVTLSVVGTTIGYGYSPPFVSFNPDGTDKTFKFTNNNLADMFTIQYSSATSEPYFRTYIYGLYVTSDW